MAGISSLSSSQSIAQSGLRQYRLQQAERNVQQAEQTARELAAAARDAQRKASEAQQEARAITGQADDAQAYAGETRRDLAAARTAGDLRAQASDVVDAGAVKPGIAELSSATPNLTLAIFNSQGQRTGGLISTVA